MSDILLISNTKLPDGSVFAHARAEIDSIMDNRHTITFIPFARPDGRSIEKYQADLEPTFNSFGYELIMIDPNNARRGVDIAEALYFGGGNTWELINKIKSKGLLYHIRQAVNRGVPYIGSSAGSNIAGLTIGNTNDMPAAESLGRDALGLVPFNVNPHFLDTLILSPERKAEIIAFAPELKQLLNHQGETREGRIREYLALNNFQTVVALREGAMLRIKDGKTVCKGETGGRVYRPEFEEDVYVQSYVTDFQRDMVLNSFL